MKYLQVPGKRWLSLSVLSLMGWMALMGLLALAQEPASLPEAPAESSQSAEEHQISRDQQVPTTKVSREKAIEMVQAAGWMQGDKHGDFQSQRALSRAELATILSKAFKLDSRKATDSHSGILKDVPATHWAASDIDTVMRLGIMKGYRPGYFYPEHRINRAEALSIMAQAYGVQQYDDATVKTILTPYSDAPQIPDWAEKAMVTALKSGFVDVSDTGKLRPLKPMTRGDMAFALGQYMNRLQESERRKLN